jgi:hypothetical protein
MRFVDPARQARFEALVRDLAPLPLREATRATADGRVRLNGTPYIWEADLMIHWLDNRSHPVSPPTESRKYHFTVDPPRG